MDEIIKEEASFFSVKAILKELKRHLIKILAVVATFAVMGGVYGLFFADLSFKSEATLIAYDDDVYADENEEIDVIQRAAATVAGMLKEASVVNVYREVVKTLESKGIVVTVESLREEITIKTNSMFIILTYETANSDAQVILDTILSECLKTVNAKGTDGQYVMPVVGGRIKIFSSATAVKGDLKGNLITNVILFAMVGAVLSIGLVLVLALLRQTFLDKESAEEELGIEILTVVEDLPQDSKGGR